MGIGSIGTDSFSLRDYVTYLFPGVLLLAALGMMRSDIWNALTSNIAATAITVLAGGYFLGYVAWVGGLMLVWPFKQFFGDPLSHGVLRPTHPRLKPVFDEGFAQSLDRRLREVWTDAIVDGKETALLYLCWRDVQLRSHQGLNYMFRLITQHNMALSTLFPIVMFGIALIYAGDVWFGLLLVLPFCAMVRARFIYRREFAKNVYRIWY
ncbi:hypothetical protein ACFL6R_07455, partial [Gemmatimonadota bacterium]